jgi:hypothetical protein
MSRAERLAQALAGGPFRGDRKAFQRVMRERLGGGHGTSYTAVLGYFSGVTEPSLTWLTEAADVLDVRVEWLVFGDEPVRPESVSEHEVAKAVPDVQRLAGRHAAALFAHLVQRIADAHPPGMEPATPEQLEELARGIHAAAFGLVGAMCPVNSRRDVERFYLAHLSALLAIIPEPGKGRPVSAVLRYLPRAAWVYGGDDVEA